MTFPSPLIKIKNLLKYLFVTLPFEMKEKAFIRHNRKVWVRKDNIPRKGEVLVEVYPIASSILAQSYLVNTLAERFGAKIVGFTPSKSHFLKRVYNFRFERIYRSFNVERFFYIDFTPTVYETAASRAKEILAGLKTKKEVEDLVVDGVWIGDLLYDSHLMKYRVPTIDFADPRFLESLTEALCFLFFWRNYLETHEVKAVVISHCVYYENGAIVRLCVAKNVPCYQVHATSCHYMDQRHDRAYNEYIYYPKVFRSLPKEEQAEGIALAEKRLQLRFSGVVGVDMPYSTKSAYGEKKKVRLLAPTEKRKILIAPHCFFDSPHPYGNNLFPDFYEWFLFLGNLSNVTDYEWYIKTHPDSLPGNTPILEELVRKFPKFRILPADSSHNQLVEEGISIVLTVFGTIGSEYAARGIPVLNSSLANPHIAYKFNLSFGDVQEYERVLMNLDLARPEIVKSEVYEYYYMYKIRKGDSWLFSDYKKFIEDIGGYYAQLHSASYDYFMKEFTQEKHLNIIATLNRYLDSRAYYLDRCHYEKESVKPE